MSSPCARTHRASIVGKKSTRKKEEELPVSHCVKIPQQVQVLRYLRVIVLC